MFLCINVVSNLLGFPIIMFPSNFVLFLNDDCYASRECMSVGIVRNFILRGKLSFWRKFGFGFGNYRITNGILEGK